MGKIDCLVNVEEENYMLLLFKNYTFNPEDPLDGLFEPNNILICICLLFLMISI